MQVRVLFFGILKELMGRREDSITLPDQSTLGDLLNHYERSVPTLKNMLASIAMSVNQEYAGPESKLNQGDEVALLPPVSGGIDSPHCELTREKIDTQKILDRIKHPEDGAAVVFEGVVRNNTRGRRTLY